MKEKVSSIGGMVAALAAASCCIGPALFLAFGITGLGFLSRLEWIRPYMLLVSFVFVGISYRYAYGRGSVCRPGAKCSPRSIKINRVLFWFLVVFVVFGLSFPYVAGWLLV
ncbi:MAG: mercuric transporter MerT family protein [Thermodesulfobacteriota bacterium]